MDGRTVDWLKLHISLPASSKTGALLAHFGSASEVLSASDARLMGSGLADRKTCDRIRAADENKARDIIEICEKNDWSIITPDDALYPASLKKIDDFPLALFCSGDTQILECEPKISVVGTRCPSEQALMAVYLLTGCLSSLGFVTVSGGAVGIDSAAHEGALTGNGGTVAVLGCGLGCDYLPENSFMRRRIEKNGLLLSEFLPFSAPTRYSFPRRNRIISALSEAIVVAQSGEKGGSLITAGFARRQKRALCCFSEDIVKSPGCSELIKNGAQVFSTPGELLEKCVCGPDMEKLDAKYLDYKLKNDGIHGIHIIKPSTMTADSFAVYNGITPEEAGRVLGKKLKQSKPDAPVNINAVQPQKQAKEKNIKNHLPENKKPAEIINKKENEPENEKAPVLPAELSEEAKKVFAALETSPEYFDEIQNKTHLSAQDIMTAVTELELEGLAVLHTGNRVSRA